MKATWYWAVGHLVMGCGSFGIMLWAVWYQAVGHLIQGFG